MGKKHDISDNEKFEVDDKNKSLVFYTPEGIVEFRKNGVYTDEKGESPAFRYSFGEFSEKYVSLFVKIKKIQGSLNNEEISVVKDIAKEIHDGLEKNKNILYDM